MIELLLIAVCAATLVVLYRLMRSFFVVATSGDPLGIEGELIWEDHGPHQAPFYNEELRILGKPDFIYKTPLGICAVEFKQRARKVMPSDIAQMMAAALRSWLTSAKLPCSQSKVRFMRLQARRPTWPPRWPGVSLMGRWSTSGLWAPLPTSLSLLSSRTIRPSRHPWQ